ncbi:hypothetical protein BWQ96_09491 [Gracilariopsis chorda]|uniref:Uncharacterized protein n=1 Tax=Gracilariopsis chorda TaxID=448386 RepID=A0A2V3IFF2_9FLOR|nr:hypothetical protein BWQ96_09491 [Gracilariopsis chorda]|eukprot:PXF40781.1 hypothetical protein BWQ96_09491 [Gracilariopsis chorda]
MSARGAAFQGHLTLPLHTSHISLLPVASTKVAVSTTCAHSAQPLNRPKRQQVVIVGGGAAGHLAAITCARNCSASVLILESGPSVLQKVCDFFENEQVPLKVEPSGKVFPTSDDSATVIRALVDAARRAGVVTEIRARVRALSRWEDSYYVDLVDGRRFMADYAVLATGSARTAHVWAQNLGHKVVETVPSLFTFGVRDERLNGLAGVSVRDCEVRIVPNPKPKRPVPGLVQRGSLLITHWGLSGPAILSLSAFGARVMYDCVYRIACIVDWVPDLALDEKLKVLKESRRILGQKRVLNIHPFRGNLPQRLWKALAGAVPGIDSSLKWANLNNAMIQALAEQLHKCRFHVSSKGQFKEEFVTAGGVDLSEINMKTFESKRSPGLYFAGETLDVDGKTGGYNLTFAWASGYIAGLSIASRVEV